MSGRIAVLAGIAVCALAAQDWPSATITNGSVRASLYLPDADNGWYRATRFDWSGIVSSLEYRGNRYFAPWKAGHDPKDHEAISGPVEDFVADGAPVGWATAKPGDSTLKIGVGVIRKPDAAAYTFMKTYEIVNGGRWTAEKAPDQVAFTQVLDDAASGYGYVYSKTVRLAKDKPDLILEHRLKNTGRAAIDTSVYNHNFFVIDDQPSGPDFTVRFLFPIEAVGGDLKNIVQVRGDELAYLRELKPGETVYTHLTGFNSTAKDYNIRVENAKTGAGVRVTSDQPLSQVVFWSAHTTLCPEAYIKLHIEPGAEATWQITYHFYTLPRPPRN